MLKDIIKTESFKSKVLSLDIEGKLEKAFPQWIDLKKCNPPFLVHSDIFRTARLIRKGLIKNPKKKHILHAHISYLENLFGAGNLIFPTYNYDFAKLKVFDVKNSESHVGVLTNYVLN